MKNKFKISKENGIIIVLAGILCLVTVWPSSGTKESQNGSKSSFGNELTTEASSKTTEENLLDIYVENQEERLRQILMQVDGVGEVEVMIRASASKEYVVEKDVTTSNSQVLETDSEGGTRQNISSNRGETSIYTKDADGKDIPWVIKELEPEIEGVLVAAQGGNNEQVKGEITQAVQVLFDIPVHKIKVVKMKGK